MTPDEQVNLPNRGSPSQQPPPSYAAVRYSTYTSLPRNCTYTRVLPNDYAYATLSYYDYDETIPPQTLSFRRQQIHPNSGDVVELLYTPQQQSQQQNAPRVSARGIVGSPDLTNDIICDLIVPPPPPPPEAYNPEVPPPAQFCECENKSVIEKVACLQDFRRNVINRVNAGESSSSQNTPSSPTGNSS